MTISMDSDVDGIVTLSSTSSDTITYVDYVEQIVEIDDEGVSYVSEGEVEIYVEDYVPDSGLGIVWDDPSDRVYETGLDKGVLYLPDGSAVPWNGLTAVIEKFDRESSPVYYDGMKINDLVVLGDFSATMKAVTYPDEFIELEGMGKPRRGLFYGDQPPQSFGLCYRTQIGNAVDGDTAGYKIHILYNITAIPNDKTYATLSSEPSLVEFEWELTAVPEEVPGYRPTAHLVIDSRDLDPWLLEELEEMLYGSSNAEAVLIPMPDLISYISEWYRVKIIDHGNGTWSAVSQREGFIHLGLDGYFDLVGVNAVYLDEHTFVINDTLDVADVPQLKISDHGNGIWSAETDHENLIVMVSAYEFEIRNTNVIWLNEHTYRITDTTD